MGRYLTSFVRANELFLTEQDNTKVGAAKMHCLKLK
jgi:hypothetical protein